MNRLQVKAPSMLTRVNDLSGGNQQKVVFAKWLMRSADVYILDEPTRGIDVGAKEEIYKLIDDLARAGKAVIVISSELPELIGVSDKFLSCIMEEYRTSCKEQKPLRKYYRICDRSERSMSNIKNSQAVEAAEVQASYGEDLLAGAAVLDKKRLSGQI